MVADIKGLVDADRGLVSRRIYIEQDIYEQELAYRISESNHREFYRRWDQMMKADSWAKL